ncbi:MAG: HlyD family type I secretion periplasmic adaptor subunit [Pikeienuella sp.]
MPKTERKQRLGVQASVRAKRQQAAPRAARSLIVVIGALIVTLLAWAALTDLQELARAEGEIAPTGALRRVDHFDGGIIRSVHVDAGDVVQAGQLLAKLDQPGLAAQTREAAQRLEEVSADIQRLNQLLADADNPPDLVRDQQVIAEKSGAEDVYSIAQHHLFLSRQAILAERVTHRSAAVTVARDLKQNAATRVALSDRSLARFKRLYDRGVVSEAQFLDQTEVTAAVRANLMEAEVEVARARIEQKEAEAALAEARLAYREEHLERLHELQKEQRLLIVKMGDLATRSARLELTAPEAGIVQSVLVSTVGEVVSPGGTVFELLPTSETLVAVVKISPKDIGHLEPGASVRIKPSTFDARRFGEVTGVIASISPTTVNEPPEEPYFKTIVKLDSDHIGQGALRRQLRAGMIVSAEIQTASRSVLSYLLKPINRSLEKSLTER